MRLRLAALTLASAIALTVFCGTALAAYKPGSAAFGNVYKHRQAIALDTTAKRVTWGYGLRGDYDQNGEVNLSDLSRLAKYLGQTVAANEKDTLKGLCDGNGDGIVNISDITPLAANLGRRFTAYRVYESADYQGYPLNPGDVTQFSPWRVLTMADSVGTGLSRRKFSLDVSQYCPGRFVWLELATDTGPPALSQICPLCEPNKIGLAYFNPDFQPTLDPATMELTFYNPLIADGDQNGQTNISDLTPIFAWLGSSGPFPMDDARWAIDSYHDGVIDQNDKFAIDIFYGTTYTGFNIYYSSTNSFSSFSDPYAVEELSTPHFHVDFVDAVQGEQKRRYWTVNLSGFALPTDYIWVRPYDSHTDGLGTRSQFAVVQ